MDVNPFNQKGDSMITFKIGETDEKLTPRTGLGLAGLLLSKTLLMERLDKIILPHVTSKPDVSNSDVAKSYLGLLCQGKSEFECIEESRDELFFQYALDIDQIPSCSTLRQRMNHISDTAVNDTSTQTILMEESAKLVGKYAHLVTPITLENNESYIPLDVDVSPFDNSNTKKEGVSWTYKRFDG